MLSDSCMVSAQQDGLVGDGPCRVEGERQRLEVVLWFPMMHVCQCLVAHAAIIIKGKKKIQKVDSNIDSFRIRTAFVKFDR